MKGKPKKGAPKGSKNAAKNKPAETADLNLDNTTTEDIAKDMKVSPKKVQQMNVIDDKATEEACEYESWEDVSSNDFIISNEVIRCLFETLTL